MVSSSGYKPARPLRPGVYAPIPTFFQPGNEALDLYATGKHAVRLAKSGLAGLVVMGSNGEAVHLNRAERVLVTKATRVALDEAGFQNVPVIVGASEQSVQGTIELCHEAAGAGAEYALVIPPSYYRAATGTEEALYEYFNAVATDSPLPVILYNYPGAVAGIDMDSDLIIRISQHLNVLGTKLTCGNTGKLTRASQAMNAITPTSPLTTRSSPATQPGPSSGRGPKQYVTFGGMADFTLQTLVSGGSAIIDGGANVLPRLCVKVFNLWSAGKVTEAIEMQKILSEGDWALTKTSIAGTKAALQEYFGYGGYPRRPLQPLPESQLEYLIDGTRRAMEVETSLKDVA